MEGMTTEGKLLAQDDIDALLGEAGLDGGYEPDVPEVKELKPREKKSAVKYSSRSEDEAREILHTLFSKAFLERENDVRVIWNASGTIPLAGGYSVKIDGKDYTSLGVIHENHLVVKEKENSNQQEQ